ncbi:MAG: MmcQ/YjbR family DNA-binding protein [Actinobacteria bacterium]|uniref:Unannotated protein n=1 Tax=freshwater metagenome TaxID=449393 RepID=A0A6J6QSE9_9ZZZZ|nr:MmcQ/YjbR family DNA-binding protein [Actinomycetota bacterium]
MTRRPEACPAATTVGAGSDDVAVASIDDFAALAAQLPAVASSDHGRYLRWQAGGKTFAYLWPATETVGLKQTIAEQLALVGERPEVFEVQFTAGGYGWVVVRLAGVDRTELAELTFEAWRLSAPSAVVAERDDRLPR